MCPNCQTSPSWVRATVCLLAQDTEETRRPLRASTILGLGLQAPSLVPYLGPRWTDQCPQAVTRVKERPPDDRVGRDPRPPLTRAVPRSWSPR